MSINFPWVSIGLPVYNGQRYIAKTIDSLLGQSFGDFELIISDNASTDRTEQICSEYAAGDKRIRYYRNEKNIGAAKNYNLTCELSRGKYFKWASHDDICAPEYLSRCMETFTSAAKNVVLCYPKATLIDENGRAISGYEDNMDLTMAEPARRLSHLVKNLKKCNAIFGLIRSDTLRETRLIGSYFASDVNLLVELALRGRFFQIPENLFFRRKHPAMSRQANRTFREVTKWFDPSRQGRYDLRLTRLFVENLHSIIHSNLSWYDKFCCFQVLPSQWFKRYWRQMAGELRQVTKQISQKAFKQQFSFRYRRSDRLNPLDDS